MKTDNGIPWRRFAVESFVIVASILLAFTIDAWWNNREESRRTRQYLSALDGEFSQAGAEMDEQLLDHERQLIAIDSLLVRLAEGRGDIWPLIEELRAVYVYGPYHPVFEDLANSSSVELLDSPELRFELLRYGQTRDFLGVISAREQRLWEELMQPFLFQNTDTALYSEAHPVQPRFEDGAEVLYQSRYFQNLLLRRRSVIASQLGLDQDVRESIVRVREEIAASLTELTN